MKRFHEKIWHFSLTTYITHMAFWPVVLTKLIYDRSFSLSLSLRLTLRLRDSSYKPSNRVGLVAGTNFVFCSWMRNFRPVDWNEIQETKPSGTYSCTACGYHGFVDYCNFTNRGNLFTSEVEIQVHIRQKLCHCCRYVANATLSCQKKFHPGLPGWSVHMGKFPSWSRNRDYRNWPSHLIRTHHHFYKERVTRGDL